MKTMFFAHDLFERDDFSGPRISDNFTLPTDPWGARYHPLRGRTGFVAAIARSDQVIDPVGRHEQWATFLQCLFPGMR